MSSLSRVWLVSAVAVASLALLLSGSAQAQAGGMDDGYTYGSPLSKTGGFIGANWWWAEQIRYEEGGGGNQTGTDRWNAYIIEGEIRTGRFRFGANYTPIGNVDVQSGRIWGVMPQSGSDKEIEGGDLIEVYASYDIYSAEGVRLAPLVGYTLNRFDSVLCSNDAASFVNRHSCTSPDTDAKFRGFLFGGRLDLDIGDGFGAHALVAYSPTIDVEGYTETENNDYVHFDVRVGYRFGDVFGIQAGYKSKTISYDPSKDGSGLPNDVNVEMNGVYVGASLNF